MTIALHVNVDHVATLRQARGTRYPDPVETALAAERAGADGITVHLREDKRHIQPRDVRLLREVTRGTFNLEMAATASMLAFALEVQPDHVTLVPERREERTTEGGLNVAEMRESLEAVVDTLRVHGIVVSLFIIPEPSQVAAAAALGASQVEFHTGEYANATDARTLAVTLAALEQSAALAHDAGLIVAAGHGLTVSNVGAVASVAHVVELNIGHAIIADALMLGIDGAVKAMRSAMDRGRTRR